MLLTDKDWTGYKYIKKAHNFFHYCQREGLSLDETEVTPLTVLTWLRNIPDKACVNKMCASENFRRTFYKITSRSKYVISLFLRFDSIQRLLTLITFNMHLFHSIFAIFFKGAQKYATDPRGAELLQSLPEYLDENFIRDTRLLSKVTSCFRISVVVDAFIYAEKVHKKIPLEPLELLLFLEEFRSDQKETTTLGIYVGKSRFISYAIRYVKEGLMNIIQLRVELNEISLCRVNSFLQHKESGAPILYEGQEVSISTWGRMTLLKGGERIKTFLKRVCIQRKLTPEEIACFDPISLTFSDYLNYQSKYPVNREVTDILRQFSAFLLNLVPEISEEYRRLKELFLHIPRKPKPKIGKKVKKLGINYISRRDYLLVIQTALTTGHSEIRLRNAVLFNTLGFLALRKSEAAMLQIGDFVLDDNNLLADMGNGYGICILPEYKSKGGYSPSNPPYHIGVVPGARELINLYLQSEFMKGYSPETFLFRSVSVGKRDDLYDDLKTDCFADPAWVRAIADRCKDIVSHNTSVAKPLLETPIKGSLSSHDFRRSCNDWIVKAITPLESRTVQRIAESHLRHKAVNLGTNAAHYQQPPELWEYILCINKSIAFPWDLNELKKWEEKNTIKVKLQSNGQVNGVNRYPDLNSIYTALKIPVTSNIELPASISTFFDKSKEEKNQSILELRSQISELESQLERKGANRLKLCPKLNKTRQALEKLLKE